MTTPTLHVRIISPQQLILDTEADSVSSKNNNGNFDILAEHANFITIVEKVPIYVRIKKQPTQKFEFPMAVILATHNQVNIYTYIQPQIDSKI